MSTPFYDLASLVVVPSGYKASKVYAQKPLTTDGQLTFTRASTATRVNASGLIESVASGVPRLDYLGSTCPKLLLEPQRTNLITYSEQFNNAAWALDGDGAGQSVTANHATSPDGTQNADRIQLNYTGGSYSRIRQDYVASGTHTISVYLKSNTGSSQKIWMRVDGSTKNKITITTDWQRFVVSGGTAAALELFIDLTDAEIATVADFSAYGAQLEAGSYATSYIPTLGAAVTRLADACLTASVPSLIGQTEGTMFIEFERTSLAAPSAFMTSNLAGTTVNSYYNSIYFYQIPNNIFVVEGYISNVQQFGFSVAALSVGTHKIALAYKANDFALYIDGVQIGTDNSGSVPAMNFFTISGTADVTNTNQNLSQALLFKTRLTNAQLAELTTL